MAGVCPVVYRVENQCRLPSSGDALSRLTSGGPSFPACHRATQRGPHQVTARALPGEDFRARAAHTSGAQGFGCNSSGRALLLYSGLRLTYCTAIRTGPHASFSNGLMWIGFVDTQPRREFSGSLRKTVLLGGNGKIRTCVGSNFTRHRSATLLLPYSYVSFKPLSHVPVKLLLRNSRATSGKPAHGLLRFVLITSRSAPCLRAALNISTEPRHLQGISELLLLPLRLWVGLSPIYRKLQCSNVVRAGG